MPDGKCPYCGSRSFYVKDPEDQYEIYEFDLEGGDLQFKPGDAEASQPPEIGAETETYCGTCAWHGRLDTLK
jgi:hypothetical protein